ncbi:MAG: sulfotransferase [Myxococcota bacterium]|jgi:hypothetical protein|nr:sulfotransferase [Myxococcota bacterium]
MRVIQNRLSTTITALKVGDLDRALDLSRRSCELRPDLAVVWQVHGAVLQARGDLPGAERDLRKALSINPESAVAWASLADLLREMGRSREPLEAYARVLELAPRNPTLLARAGYFLLEIGQLDHAEKIFHSAIQCGGDLSPVAGLVTVMERLGRIEQATSVLDALGEQVHQNRDLALWAARVYRRAGLHSRSLDLLEGLLASGVGTAMETLVRHTLGDVLDELGLHERAFDAWSRANELRRIRFDVEQWEQGVNRTLERFSPAMLADPPLGGNSDPLPVFVVGMPRSGTTLVERVLSGHPEVVGCGELDDLREVAQGLSWPLDPASLRAGADRYLQRLRGLAGDAVRAVDKMPHNFLFLGEAACLLPGARVIVCRRDPLDTCFSCFRTHLQGSHDYATSLESIGAFWRGFDRLATHWTAHLPLPLHVVRYENLVNNPERESRALLDFLELPWNPACLATHGGDRFAATASYAQVRRPIYRSSVGRADPYHSHLEPLVRALGLARHGVSTG